MLEGLFDEEAAEFESKESGGTDGQRIPRPSSPRNNTGLCGLSNLGATCYLNSLLQTLHFTPEFREELFKLGEDELGVFSSGKDADNSMVRVIPVQLQKLFANLLLLNQQSCSVDALTSSFGWSNSEEFQQHDVQELNRILFSAIESSLLGTSGEQLIAKLYHGISVQQIICQSCGRVSEREEGYLDLPVALSSGPDLEAVLREGYIEQELLEGANQYRCERCGKLVDAKRGCKLRKLPQILTFALLRFLYDFEKGERYKDTSKFKFPLELDMAPYCEDGAMRGVTVYELYSVVIHSGSTHSGHYTAYIRDVDRLGSWTSPDEEVVQLPPDPTTGSVDLLDFDNPADLMVELLKQCGGSASMSKLTKALQEKTGVTWNKRFKKQFGPIAKFLQSCPDMFSVSETSLVSLCQSQQGRQGFTGEKSADSTGGDSPCSDDKTSTSGASGESDEQNVKKTVKATARKVPTPSPGLCWFGFNDTHVSPILSKQMERMFQGKQSAYMLFYRKKSMQRPPEAMGNKLFGVPERFQIEVAEANAILDQERYQYDIAINTVQLSIHFSLECVMENGALQRIDEGSEPCLLSIDRRKSIGELKEAIAETFSGLYDPDNVVIHAAKILPSGMHLYDCVSDDDETSISDAGIANNSHLFVWDGDSVGGEPIQVGRSHEPILLHVTYPSDDGESVLSHGYPKSSTLGELRVYLAQLLEIQASLVAISHVKLSERDGASSITVLFPSKDGTTLEGLKLQDGDKLAVEKHVKKGVKSLAHSVADKHSKMFQLIVENRLMVPLHLVPPSHCYPPVPGELVDVGSLEINKEATVEELKLMILTLPALDQVQAPLPGFMRVRELVNGRPGKIFKLHSHTMRRLKLGSGSKVCCTVLSQEEDLTTTMLVFNLCVRIPGERRYGPPTEVTYDTAQSSSPYSLRSHVSQLLGLPLDRLRMAKHKLESFEWIRIQDSYQTDGKKGRKKGGTKVNVRNSPIMLKDGDTIGVKDLQYDPDDSDDFSTPLDDQGKTILAAVQEDKRQRRKAKGNTDMLTQGSFRAKQRRQEVGIKIFVPDYRTTKQKPKPTTTL